MKTTVENSKKIIGFYICFSLILLLITALTGSLSSLYYGDLFLFVRDNLKLSFQNLRPIHTLAAISWIFVSGISFVLYYLFTHEKINLPKLITQFKVIVLLWISAGAISIYLLFMNNFTGREYLVFPPQVSLLVLSGWLVYAYAYFSRIKLSAEKWPIYKWMWGTSIFLFITSFIEGHLYLISFFSNHPMRDMAVEWKSYGSLIGSFNLIVYGNLIYLSEKITGDKEYAHSKKAFFLYIIGTLNSFTNYVHHTYHLPESPWAKTFSFIVSMLEVIILVKVFFDLWGIKKTIGLRNKYPVPAIFMASATFWTFFQLMLGIIISIPPLNSLIHGTTVVLAHSMGTMIGIDTMAQLAVVSYLQQEIINYKISQNRIRVNNIIVFILNFSLLLFWIVLINEGINAGRDLHTQGILPSSLTFSSFFTKAFPMLGLFIFSSLSAICLTGVYDWYNARNSI